MIDLILIVLAAFVLLDYVLGRVGVRDNARLISALVFAVVVLLAKVGVA